MADTIIHGGNAVQIMQGLIPQDRIYSEWTEEEKGRYRRLKRAVNDWNQKKGDRMSRQDRKEFRAYFVSLGKVINARVSPLVFKMSRYT